MQDAKEERNGKEKRQRHVGGVKTPRQGKKARKQTLSPLRPSRGTRLTGWFMFPITAAKPSDNLHKNSYFVQVVSGYKVGGCNPLDQDSSSFHGLT